MGAMSACSRVGHPSWVILNIRLMPQLPLPHTSGVEARSTKRRWVTHADSLTSDSRTFPLPTTGSLQVPLSADQSLITFYFSSRV